MLFSGDNLVVFANPDDETTCFGGLLVAQIAERADLVCVTDGNFQGRGVERRAELAQQRDFVGHDRACRNRARANRRGELARDVRHGDCPGLNVPRCASGTRTIRS